MSSEPIDLTSVEATGAIRFGVPVAELRIVLEDGRVIKLALPLKAKQSDTRLTPTERKIMDVLAKSPEPMTRLAVAFACNRENSNGSFGTMIRRLMQSQLIYTNGDMITDDPSKF